MAPLLMAVVLLFTPACDAPRPESEVHELDPAEAAEHARQIRQEVSAQLADGLALSLWASDALVADPIALDVDDRGRAFYTRTQRQKHSEFDIRGHVDWMTRSISLETVEDRRAFLREEFAPERSAENEWLVDLNADSSHDWRDLAVEKEQVYRVEDRSGDGVADAVQMIIEDFNEEITDIAGAVLAHGDDVFLGVGPDLWRLQDTSGDGVIDSKTSISHGYAVHIGFSGHGMSGLTLGPDGRVYWSIGDIGFSITAPDGTPWDYPNEGAILRSNPDGSDFEVYAAGLRNTHEFAFDAYGNLISVDNDGDHENETERLVYVVNGSDSGWRANWQYGKYTDPDNNAYKVWMDEELFKPRFEGQAAYITPPVAAYHSGPAGMAYNPGTALNDAWRDYFFVAEFPGTPARARIWGFRLDQKGATFELAEEKRVVQGILATGLDFGPDGALYFADWINGWGTNDRGRIWKLDVPGADSTALRTETRALLAEDFGDRGDDELGQLLQHADMRVRMKAQFALAERGEDGAAVLRAAAQQTGHQLARLHGLWGIGQLARQDSAQAEPLTSFLGDADPEVRAQAAKVIGDIRYAAAAEALLPMLADAEARPRFFAAEALGRIAYGPAVQPIIEMLADNDDEDAYLRHAGALALARIGDAGAVVALADHPTRGVRIAAVVALRRMQHPGVARFLQDDDEHIVTEAARAINDDHSIEEALPDLAAVLENTAFSSEPLLRRALNAHLRLGTRENAESVASYAASVDRPEAMRAEAIEMLGVWPNPSVLDRVDGRYRGPVSRDPAVARAAFEPILGAALRTGSLAMRVAACESAARLGLGSAAPALLTTLRQDRAPEVRTAALLALQAIGHDGMDEAMQAALADRDQGVRMTALGLIPTLELPEDQKVTLLSSVLDRRSIEEQQSALAALGRMGGTQSGEVLGGLMDRLEAGELAPEVQLDLMEAIDSSGIAPLGERLAAYREARPTDDPLLAYSEALHGGDPDAGGRLVFQHPQAQCIRCHAVGGRGGDVGPDLSGIGQRFSREQLLQSLVDPSAVIAPGYGAATVTLRDGQTVQGVVSEETDSTLVLLTGEGEPRTVAKADITQRSDGTSSMPPMGLILTRRELRNVVAFLSELQ